MNALDDVFYLWEILEKSRRIVFFGGAGVSTASGIPDFRSDEGLQSMGPDPEEVLSKTFFYLQPEAFFDYYRKYLLHPEAKPNAVHRYLFKLEKQDKLQRPGTSGCTSCTGTCTKTTAWNAARSTRWRPCWRRKVFPAANAAG